MRLNALFHLVVAVAFLLCVDTANAGHKHRRHARRPAAASAPPRRVGIVGGAWVALFGRRGQASADSGYGSYGGCPGGVCPNRNR